MKILGDLETDVPASDHHRPPRSRFAEGRHDAIEVGDVAQGEDALGVGAGDPRPYRLGARGQQQAIVRLVRLDAGLEIAQAHRPGGAVDGERLGAGSYVDPVTRLEHRLPGDEKLVPFGDHAGDGIGQPAIGEADVGTALDEHDVRRFADAAQACGRGGAASHAADDDDLHDALCGLVEAPVGATGLQIRILEYYAYLGAWSIGRTEAAVALSSPRQRR